MSETEIHRDNSHDAGSPRLDPWLIVLLLSIVPMLASLAARDLVYHLAGISAILFAAALGMLKMQERRRR
jgi:hypothetical protein